jgi:hypothetical protein
MIQFFFELIQSLHLLILFIIKGTLHWQSLLADNMLNYVFNLCDVWSLLLLKSFNFLAQKLILVSQFLQIRKAILLYLISLFFEWRRALHLSKRRNLSSSLLLLFCKRISPYFLLRIRRHNNAFIWFGDVLLLWWLSFYPSLCLLNTLLYSRLFCLRFWWLLFSRLTVDGNRWLARE